MPAIRIHHTATDDGRWDGPTNEARLRLSESETYYRSAFAWIDPDADPQTKAAYKFIHHFVSSDGTVVAASTRACIAGIAVLNGARGGTTIPDADRQGVYNHLAAHLKDADMEPPDLKAQPADEEKDLKLDLKQLDETEGTFEGDLSVYGAVDALGDVVEPGAFTRTLKSTGGKIPLLWAHDVRSPIGLLELRDTPESLQVKGTINLEDAHGRQAHSMLKFFKRTGLNMGLSIGFLSLRDEVKNGIRYLKELRLFEGSLVCFPANRLCYVTDVKQIESKDFQSSLATIQGWQIRQQIIDALCEALMEAFYADGMTRDECMEACEQAWDDAKAAFMGALPGMMDSRNGKLVAALTEKGREIARQVASWAKARAELEVGTSPVEPAGEGERPAADSSDPDLIHSLSTFRWR